MATLIKTMDHAFASGFHDVAVGARAVLAWEQKKVQPDAPQIETISALVPVYGPEIVIMERLAFASLGVLADMVHANGSAAKAAAQNPGIGLELLQAVESLLQANPSLISQAEALVAKA
ncbi:MAG TPA: hypothetical protein VMI06_04445 [Terriglobia bacterium]|nr:hypothetical protein [Terriglobia bacterium]